MGLATRDLGGGRFVLGDSHGDFIEVEEVTHADIEARERELAKWSHKKAVMSQNDWRKRSHPNMAKGDFVSSIPAKQAIDMLAERGFTQSEICKLASMSSKRVSEIRRGKQLRVRQGTVDKLTELLMAAVNGEVMPKLSTRGRPSTKVRSD